MSEEGIKYKQGMHPNSLKSLKVNRYNAIGNIPWNKGLHIEYKPRKYNFNKQKIEKMINNNRTLKEVANFYNSSIYGVYNFMKRNNISAMSPYESHQRKECKDKCRAHRMSQRFINKETSIEKIMRNLLELNNVKFTSQEKIITSFPDFYVETNGQKYCIYCDGDYWHNIEKVKLRDRVINKKLLFAGYIPVRFTEEQLNKELDYVKNRLDFLGVFENNILEVML